VLTRPQSDRLAAGEEPKTFNITMFHARPPPESQARSADRGSRFPDRVRRKTGHDPELPLTDDRFKTVEDVHISINERWHE
jgi:hypothetical protein